MSSSVEEFAKQFASQLEEADSLAYKSDLAYATGNFNKYWDDIVEDTQKRLEDEYDSISIRRTNGEDSRSSTDESDSKPISN